LFIEIGYFMNYRYVLLTLLFGGIASQSWCQQNAQSLLEDKLLAEGKIIPLNQADTLNSNAVLIKDYVLIKDDSLFIYNRIRTDIVGKAHDYIGVSYRYGQSSEKGFDCSGYVKFVYGIFGFALPHSSYAQYRMCKHLKESEVQPGDLVFFNTRGKGRSHVGIYLGENRFIHAPSRGKFVSIDSLNSDYYKRHFAGFGSLLKMTAYKRSAEPGTIITKPLMEKILLSQSSLPSYELMKCGSSQ
jgi:hypothetical protein